MPAWRCFFRLWRLKAENSEALQWDILAALSVTAFWMRFVKVTVATDVPGAAAEVESLKKSMRAESVEFVPAGSDLAMPSKITKYGTVYLSLEGLVDKAAEAKRIAGELAKIGGFIKSAEAKLANENFVAHAPEAVVAEARRKLAENKEKVAQLEKLAKLFA